MKVTVYGHSDDLIEVDGDIREEFNANESGNFLAFSDGTVLRVKYDKYGRWDIRPMQEGSAEYEHEDSFSDEGKRDDEFETPAYSDRVVLTGDLTWVLHGTDLAGPATKAEGPALDEEVAGADLLSTTDAREWARAFVGRFAGRMVSAGDVDEGLMLSWFANAIETGRTAGAEGKAQETRSTP